MITNPVFRKQRDFAEKNHSDYLPLRVLILCVCGHMACKILVPNPGSNPCPLQWKCGFSTTGPPGKSLEFLFTDFYLFYFLKFVYLSIIYLFFAVLLTGP